MAEDKKPDDLEQRLKKLETKRVNDIAGDINAITEITLSDVTGTPNVAFDPSGTDTIIANLQTQNNLLNGQVDVLISTVNKILQNIKRQ